MQDSLWFTEHCSFGSAVDPRCRSDTKVLLLSTGPRHHITHSPFEQISDIGSRRSLRDHFFQCYRGQGTMLFILLSYKFRRSAVDPQRRSLRAQFFYCYRGQGTMLFILLSLQISDIGSRSAMPIQGLNSSAVNGAREPYQSVSFRTILDMRCKHIGCLKTIGIRLSRTCRSELFVVLGRKWRPRYTNI
jgi:hypothetical protein